MMSEPIKIHIIDEDVNIRAKLSFLLTSINYHVETYESEYEFLARWPTTGIIVVDRDISESEIFSRFCSIDKIFSSMPAIVLSRNSDVNIAVNMMKAGAYDFLIKPINPSVLIESINSAWTKYSDLAAQIRRSIVAQERLAKLTHREREVLDHLASGKSNKEIARILEISPRTVELHRAHIMFKLDAVHVSNALRTYFESGL